MNTPNKLRVHSLWMCVIRQGSPVFEINPDTTVQSTYTGQVFRGRRDRVVAAGHASVVRILLTPSATHWPLTVHQCQSWALSKVVRHTLPTSPTLRYDTSSGQPSTFVWTISLRDLDLSCLVALSRREKIRRAAIAISSPPVTKRLNHF